MLPHLAHASEQGNARVMQFTGGKMAEFCRYLPNWLADDALQRRPASSRKFEPKWRNRFRQQPYAPQYKLSNRIQIGVTFTVNHPVRSLIFCTAARIVTNNVLTTKSSIGLRGLRCRQSARTGGKCRVGQGRGLLRAVPTGRGAAIWLGMPAQGAQSKPNIASRGTTC